MSKEEYVSFIMKTVNKDNLFKIIETFICMFENGILIKPILNNEILSSIQITYASSTICNKYQGDIVNIIKKVYPNVKNTGSYKMMTHHSIIYFYSI